MELSIVLLILALLTGGILGGVSVVRAMELRRVIQEAEGFRAAVNTFQLRYNALPGDFEGATQIWGKANPTASTCFSMDKTHVAGTCDGSGNGRVAENTNREEHFLFWHHLQKAGLIQGVYSGASDPACSGCLQSHTPGLNSPASAKGRGTGWGAYYKGYSDGLEADPNWFVGQYRNILSFGGQHVNAMGAPQDAMANKPALTVNETWNIDVKMDDGMPATGNVVVRTGDYSGLAFCTETTPGSGVSTSNDDLDSVYRLTREDQIDCNLIIRNAF